MHEEVYLKNAKGKHSLMTLHDDVKSIFDIQRTVHCDIFL